MDRRQRKTREAIFGAFIHLLTKKNFNQITVGEIIEAADVGRATFYAHFETKDFLLKELCGELFCHLFDTEQNVEHDHRHIFTCDGSQSIFLHLFEHLQKNDNNLLTLLSSPNNELFMQCFGANLRHLVADHMDLFADKNRGHLPLEFWQNHIVSTFLGTLTWWIENGMKESPQIITEYFMQVV